jgi:alpha/beta superfamily hydrolase
MDNKVVQTLARAFVANAAMTAVRFNFRGVGASAPACTTPGSGELRGSAGRGAAGGTTRATIALAGFSFGAFVTSHALAALWATAPRWQQAVLVGTAASRFDRGPRASPRHICAHLGAAWRARRHRAAGRQCSTGRGPQILPVTVVPGGGHFFPRTIDPAEEAWWCATSSAPGGEACCRCGCCARQAALSTGFTLRLFYPRACRGPVLSCPMET